ncbi:MAG: hypothetical protein AAF432_14915, partial [Planctomycetota bacterium]
EDFFVQPSVFNTALGLGPDINVTLSSSSQVDASECANAAVSIQVEYLAQGTTPDCNGNGLPDSCDFEQVYEDTSEVLTPIGHFSPQTWTLHDLPPVIGDVTLDFAVSGDFNAVSEQMSLFINDVFISPLFDFQTSYCGMDNDSITIPASVFAPFVNDGPVEIAMITTQNVNPNGCVDSESYVIASISYDALGPSFDADMNGVPDECLQANCPADCSPVQPDGTLGNGVVNIGDIVTVLDAMTTQNPDCDVAPILENGIFGNGVVNLDDLLVVINSFGPCGE